MIRAKISILLVTVFLSVPAFSCMNFTSKDISDAIGRALQNTNEEGRLISANYNVEQRMITILRKNRNSCYAYKFEIIQDSESCEALISPDGNESANCEIWKKI